MTSLNIKLKSELKSNWFFLSLSELLGQFCEKSLRRYHNCENGTDGGTA